MTTTLGRVWLSWVAHTALGYFFGILVGFPLAAAFESVSGGLLSVLLFGGVLGGAVGVAQRPVLRDRLPGFDDAAWRGWLRAGEMTAAGWVVAGMLGVPAGFVAGGGMASALGVEYAFELGGWNGVLWWAISLFAGGLLSGVIQYAVLRRHVSHAGWWVAACATGWSASALALALVVVGEHENLMFFLVAPVLAGVLLGVITGGAFVWLLGRSSGELVHETGPVAGPDEFESRG